MSPFWVALCLMSDFTLMSDFDLVLDLGQVLDFSVVSLGLVTAVSCYAILLASLPI